MRRPKTADAIEILHRRYIGADAERAASLEEERVNAQVARTIRELREDAGLTQKGLAAMVGTTQSVISRLEDADYEGHSLTMLDRIARALNQRVKVLMASGDQQAERLRDVFRELVRGLRRERELTVDELAKKLEMDRNEIIAMERNPGYRPSPVVLHKLGQLYGIPTRRLAALAGAIKETPEGLVEEASRFAAQSDSLAKLSRQERQVLDRFVNFLKSEEL
jgi:transcriptional regulator with XRE-family HTH domain